MMSNAPRISPDQEQGRTYFLDLQTVCPYGLPFVATFHQAMFCPIDQRIMELFLAAGYRRNGNCLYTMRCVGCSACIPIRLDRHDLQTEQKPAADRQKKQ